MLFNDNSLRFGLKLPVRFGLSKLPNNLKGGATFQKNYKNEFYLKSKPARIRIGRLEC
jgi:hypothetical protein